MRNWPKILFRHHFVEADNGTELKYRCPNAPLNMLSPTSEDKNCFILNLNFIQRFRESESIPYCIQISKIKKCRDVITSPIFYFNEDSSFFPLQCEKKVKDQ